MNTIKEYIKESVRQVIREDVERQAIREIVKNELRKMYNEGVFEGGKREDDDKEKDSVGATDTARGQLKNILDNNPMIKKSQIAYALHPGVDHDSARHIFQDQLEGSDKLTTREANTAIDLIHNAGV
jgi:hypothetical protein